MLRIAHGPTKLCRTPWRNWVAPSILSSIGERSLLRGIKSQKKTRKNCVTWCVEPSLLHWFLLNFNSGVLDYRIAPFGVHIRVSVFCSDLSFRCLRYLTELSCMCEVCPLALVVECGIILVETTIFALMTYFWSFSSIHLLLSSSRRSTMFAYIIVDVDTFCEIHSFIINLKY